MEDVSHLDIGPVQAALQTWVPGPTLADLAHGDIGGDHDGGTNEGSVSHGVEQARMIVEALREGKRVSIPYRAVTVEVFDEERRDSRLLCCIDPCLVHNAIGWLSSTQTLPNSKHLSFTCFHARKTY